jgi:hypothetical protein
VAGGTVVWVESGPPGATDSGAVGSSGISAPDPFPLAAQEPAPHGIFTDGTSVFWVDSASPFAVRSDSLSGRNQGLDVTGSDAGTNPRAVVVDDQYVYWVAEATGTSGGSLRRVATTAGITGAAVETLATGLLQPRALALADNHVLVVNYGSSDAALDGSLVRVPKDGIGPVETLLPSEPHPVAVMVGGAGEVYWATAGAFDGGCNCFPDGQIKRMPLDREATPTVLAGQQVGVTGLVLDDAAIYWTTTGPGAGQGSIVRLAR